MARRKTVMGGLSIGPDVELLILVGGGLALAYWLWTKYGSSAATSIGSDISNMFSSSSSLQPVSVTAPMMGSGDSIDTAAGI
jgi:hypothetical protein